MRKQREKFRIVCAFVLGMWWIWEVAVRKLVTIYITLVVIAEAGLLGMAFTRCLPDTEDRFFMGRSSSGSCLYAEGDARGEVYER